MFGIEDRIGHRMGSVGSVGCVLRHEADASARATVGSGKPGTKFQSLTPNLFKLCYRVSKRGRNLQKISVIANRG